MEWDELRKHYEHLFNVAKKRGETQETVAERGGLRQNKISELLSNDRLGPRVETFVKAVEGLGLTVSAFFAELERPKNQGLQSGTHQAENRPTSHVRPADDADTLLPPDDTLADLERSLGRTIIRTVRLAQTREQAASPRAHRAGSRPRTRKNR